MITGFLTVVAVTLASITSPAYTDTDVERAVAVETNKITQAKRLYIWNATVAENERKEAEAHAAWHAEQDRLAAIAAEEARVEAARQAVVEAPVATTPPTAPPTTVAPAPAPVSSGSVWDSLAQCESGGNWSINTGNGYYGGLQFSLSSWQAVGGTGYPHEHSRETQIAMGEKLRAIQGWGAWPSCSSRLGLR
jgi:hypothetical protein